MRWMESKLDVVFSTGNWSTKGIEWTTLNHAIVTGSITTQIKKRKLLVTDWEAWSCFIADEEEDAKYQDPFGTLKAMANENLKAKKFTPKPWWDAEIREQRQVARRAGRTHGEWRKEAAKLRNMIKQKKR